MRTLPLLLFAALALFAAGCNKPDASDVTSPSARSLLGTTTATSVTYAGTEAPPAVTGMPGDWEFQLGNARYSKLENDQAAIQVVTRTTAEAGFVMDIWLWREGDVPLQWSGGLTSPYDGVMCFQLRLEDGGEAAQLAREQYYLTIGFREATSEEYTVVQSIEVAGTVPELDGALPGEGSRVGSELLGCPRSVI